MKRFTGVLMLLLLALALTAVPTRARGEAAWTLDAGVLTLSGSGPMANFLTAQAAPWYAQRAQITKIVVQSGITHIGSNSFTGCENVTEVILPDGLTSIGKNAFWGCTALPSVSLPASLEEIGTCAFFRSGLTAVTIPESVTELAQGVFGQCQSLQTVTLHDGINVIRKDAFSRCYVLRQLKLPVGLEHIGAHAFLGCVLLENLEFYENLSYIDSAAFYGCSSLSQLTFYGSAPVLAADAFLGLRAAVLYPVHDPSWQKVAGSGYGGEVSWESGCEHQYASVFMEPTCITRGYSVFTCSLCGYSYKGLYVDALGHSFTAYTSDGNATASADGTKTASCDRGCGAKDTVPDEGSRLQAVITSDAYTIGPETVSCIPADTTADAFLQKLQQKNVRLMKDGQQVTGSVLVGTGTVVQLLAGEQVLGAWSLMVTGDVNGDGRITVTDMLAVKAHLLKKAALTGLYQQTADASGDGNISITDFIQIKAHILKKSQIAPK